MCEFCSQLQKRNFSQRRSNILENTRAEFSQILIFSLTERWGKIHRIVDPAEFTLFSFMFVQIKCFALTLVPHVETKLRF